MGPDPKKAPEVIVRSWHQREFESAIWGGSLPPETGPCVLKSDRRRGLPSRVSPTRMTAVRLVCGPGRKAHQSSLSDPLQTLPTSQEWSLQ